MKSLRKKYIGDKAFYTMVLTLVIPMIIQKGVTNFVSLLDNIMVGQMGTEQMTGVAIANQLIFVFNLCIFGAVSGVGIFTAQYFGSHNLDGVRSTFQLKLIITTILTVLTLLLFASVGGNLIRQYLLGNTSSGDIEAAFRYGRTYIFIMMIGLLPFAWSQCYSSTLRECGQTVVPMIASIASVVANLLFNYVLIFGKFGAPRLGAAGAAIATVIARFVELGVMILWIRLYAESVPYFESVFHKIQIPKKLLKNVIIKGTPLMLNETLWAAAQAMINQCYSTVGMEVVAAISITSTISNLFYVVYFSLGESIAIIVGQQLGLNDMEQAVDTDRKLIFFSVASCVVVGICMICVAPFFPRIYKTDVAVKEIAKSLIVVAGAFMPVYAYEHATYFTMRSGGRTFITFIFDSVFAWCVNVSFYGIADSTALYGLSAG